jgi:hypothetical protein
MDVLTRVMGEELHHRDEIMEIPWQMNIGTSR